MKILPISTLVFLFSISIGYSQHTLPYSNSFKTAAEKADWAEYRLGASTQTNYVWNFFNDALRHTYPVGGTQVTDDWMVSGEFDFSKGALLDSIRTRFAGFGTPMTGDTIALYLLNGDRDPSKSASKTILDLYTDTSYKNDNMWRVKEDITIPKITGKSYLAFRYKTIVNWLNVSFDDIKVIDAPPPSGLSHPEIKFAIHIYPNPVSEYLIIQTNAGYQPESIELINHLGVVAQIITSIEQPVSVTGLPKGMYYLRMKSEGQLVVRPIVIQ